MNKQELIDKLFSNKEYNSEVQEYILQRLRTINNNEKFLSIINTLMDTNSLTLEQAMQIFSESIHVTSKFKRMRIF